MGITAPTPAAVERRSRSRRFNAGPFERDDSEIAGSLRGNLVPGCSDRTLSFEVGVRWRLTDRILHASRTAYDRDVSSSRRQSRRRRWRVGGDSDKDDVARVGRDARRSAGFRVRSGADVAVAIVAQRGPVERNDDAGHGHHVYGVLRRDSHDALIGTQLQWLFGDTDVLEPAGRHGAGCWLRSRPLLGHDLHVSSVWCFERVTRDGAQYDSDRAFSARWPCARSGGL